MANKIKDYFAGGALMVWVVNPKAKSVLVYRSSSDFTTLTENDTLDGGEVVPGFQVAVAEIFAI